KEGKYVIKPTVKDNHNGSSSKHQFDDIELEISKGKPIIELDGIEQGMIYHSDHGNPTLKIKVKDRNPFLNITYIEVNGKKHTLSLNEKGEGEYTFDEDGKYTISVISENLFFNRTTTDEMTFFVHQDEIV